jgi:putative transcriptional regulator
MDNTMQSFQGQLLLDGGTLNGSFFSRSVVLICQHDKEGAFGLILNRCMDHSIQELTSEIVPTTLEDTLVFVGGPVQPGALSFLISDQLNLGEMIIPDVSIGHSFDQLTNFCKTNRITQNIRLFSGYSGWNPGQLDDEIKQGAWMTHPADRNLIFDIDAKKLWRHIMYQKGWKKRMLADSPEDLASN